MQTSTDRDGRRAGGTQWLARWLVVTLTALFGVAAALPGHAQPQPTQGDASAADPPSRAARLSEVNGQVWLYNPDSNEWASAARNQPLTSGDRIATDNDGRAEITLGTTTLRLDTTSELEIVRLDDARYAVRLHGGSVAARVRNAQALDEFELATDEGSFRAAGRRPLSLRPRRADQRRDGLRRPGDLRERQHGAAGRRRPACAVLDRRRRRAAVRDGGAGQRRLLRLERGPRSQRRARRRAALRLARDDRRRGPRPLRPVAADAGLRRRSGCRPRCRSAGRRTAPATGPGSGRGDGPGSTTQRWGFAPFHYGRWVNYRNAWCWAPGTYVARPVYAPALVAWVGGPRVGVSLAVGGGAPVGWFPARAARGLCAELPRQPALRARGELHARHQRHDDHDDRQQPSTARPIGAISRIATSSTR